MEAALNGNAMGGERMEARNVAFLGFLTLLNVMNFVDRQLLASFANWIKPALELSDTEFGFLTGFAFILFYSVMGLFAGALADMVHRPRLVAGALALWSLLTAVSGMARNFVTLAVPRALIGVGESVMTPAAMSMLADRFPPKRLGFAAGFYYQGVPIGVGASLLVAGYLAPAIDGWTAAEGDGWRNCFYLLGAVGVALAGVMLLVRETPRRSHATDAELPAMPVAPPDAPPRQSFREILRTLLQALANSRALVFTMAGGVAAHFILGAAAFDQLWLVEEREFEREFIAQRTGWIAVFAGVAGNLFGGWAGDKWQEVTGQGRPMFLFWITLLLTPLGIAYRLVAPDSLFFWVCVVSGFFQLGCFYGPTFSTVQELAPPQIRASVVAFYILMLNLVGLGIGITGGGMLVDALRDGGAAQPYTWTLICFTVLSASAIPCFWIAGRRFAADREQLYAALAGRG